MGAGCEAAQVDARMAEIEEKLQAEIEAEEQAFREKEEKEKHLDSVGQALGGRWLGGDVACWVRRNPSEGIA